MKVFIYSRKPEHLANRKEKRSSHPQQKKKQKKKTKDEAQIT